VKSKLRSSLIPIVEERAFVAHPIGLQRFKLCTLVRITQSLAIKNGSIIVKFVSYWFVKSKYRVSRRCTSFTQLSKTVASNLTSGHPRRQKKKTLVDQSWSREEGGRNPFDWFDEFLLGGLHLKFAFFSAVFNEKLSQVF
jgi:hypothetical protein